MGVGLADVGLDGVGLTEGAELPVGVGLAAGLLGAELGLAEAAGLGDGLGDWACHSFKGRATASENCVGNSSTETWGAPLPGSAWA